MWKKNSRVACVLLLAMLLLSALCAPALAIDPMLPRDQIDGGYSILVYFTTDGKPMEVANGVNYRVYRIADMVDDFGQMEFTPHFQDLASKYDLNDMSAADWKAAVPVMAEYAEQNGKPTVVNSNGKPNTSGAIKIVDDVDNDVHVTAGLYLMVFDRAVEEYRYFEMEPQLVAVPYWETVNGEDRWVYNVVIQKKVEGNDRTDLIDITVNKVWDDDGWEESTRPDTISITLYADGKKHDTITLPRKVGSKEYWNYTWTKLDPAIKWTVEETKPANYTPQYDPAKGKLKKVSATEYEVTITNYRPPKSSDSTLPQTGLNWWPVAALAVSGMVLVFLGWLARRADEESEEV